MALTAASTVAGDRRLLTASDHVSGSASTSRTVRIAMATKAGFVIDR